MKYTIETINGDIKETLEVEGKTYEKEWKAVDHGYLTMSDDFAEQLAADGYNDEDFLEKVDAAFNSMAVTDIASAFKGYN